MVVQVRIDISKNLKKFPKQLKVYAWNINNRTFGSTKEQAEEIVDIMRSKIRRFSFTNELFNSTGVKTIKREKTSHSVIIGTDSEHSIFNEDGVREHWVKIKPGSKLEKWVEKKYIGDADIRNPGFIKIGGSKSNIQKGRSDNEFFQNSIEQYLRGNRSRTQYVKALRTATKETFKI